MFLSVAKKILLAAFERNSKLITADFQKDFMEEKIKHSYQVLGMGNLLLKHEACFERLSKEDKDYLQAVVLLHDVGRFEEIIKKKSGERFDHGVRGAQILEGNDLFNAPDCVLPIRHHGHLIDCLYSDEDFKRLPETMRQRVRLVSFLVRDADKLANFYLLAKNFKEIEDVFFAAYCFKEPHSQKISAEVRADFMAHKSVRREYICNFADLALFFVAWVFDLNFKTSFEVLGKLRIMEKLIFWFSKFWAEADACLIEQEVKAFVCAKMSKI